MKFARHLGLEICMVAMALSAQVATASPVEGEGSGPLSPPISFPTYQYDCQIRVFAPGPAEDKKVSVKLPGTQDFTISGITLRVAGNRKGRLWIRLGLEKQGFPYSSAFGDDYPKTLGASLITEGDPHGSVNCKKTPLTDEIGAAVLHFENHLLVDAVGRTVYTYDKDPGGSSSCYGSCAYVWPAVLAPLGSDSLPAGVTTTKRTDGTTQLVYRGHPVYYYVGDSKAGEKSGDGLDKIWHIVTH